MLTGYKRQMLSKTQILRGVSEMLY